MAENRQAPAYDHHHYAYEFLNWKSKANFTYAPETMSSTDRRTDRRTDKVNPVYPPPTSLGGGIIMITMFLKELLSLKSKCFKYVLLLCEADWSSMMNFVVQATAIE